MAAADSERAASDRPMVTSVVPVVGGQPASQPLDLKKGVASVAKTDEVGELFRYAIGTPVTLAHSQSALLPIVNEPIKGQRVSIYDPRGASRSILWPGCCSATRPSCT